MLNNVLKTAIKFVENSRCTDEEFKSTFPAQKVNLKSRFLLFFTFFIRLTLLDYNID